MQPTPVKVAAQRIGLPTLEPERLRPVAPALHATGADLFAVTSYGKIVPPAILDVPRYGSLNVHPSLLPLYRGATPLQAQLRDGVTRGGVTVILMDAGMDTGDIVVQRESAIGPSETYGALHERFSQLGAELLTQACREVAEGVFARLPQAGLKPEDEVAHTLTHPLTKSDLSLTSPGADMRDFALVNKIRSLAPTPGARADLPKFGLSKVLAGHILADGPPLDVPVGSCVAVRGWLLVRASDGWIALDEVVVPGRRAMRIADFRAGYRLTEPDIAQPVLERWLSENEARLLGYALA